MFAVLHSDVDRHIWPALINRPTYCKKGKFSTPCSIGLLFAKKSLRNPLGALKKVPEKPFWGIENICHRPPKIYIGPNVLVHYVTFVFTFQTELIRLLVIK
jgi:hypothetical protein